MQGAVSKQLCSIINWYITSVCAQLDKSANLCEYDIQSKLEFDHECPVLNSC